MIDKVTLTAALVAALTLARPIAAAPLKAIYGRATDPRSRSVDATKAGCASAYEAAQEERLEKQLLSARGHLVTCGSTSCPAAMQRECIGWLAEVDAALPTVVVHAFAADASPPGNVNVVGMETGEKGETTEVRVLVDGREVASRLDGSAIPLDPGPHVFRFEHAGDAPVEQQHVLVEGERLKAIEVRFGGRVATSRKVGWPVWVAAGTSVVGLASFTAFGTAGLVQYEHLKSTCAPSCSPSSSNDVKARFAIADVSLGIGVVAAGVAAALYFSGKGAAPDPKPSALRIDLGAAPTGAFARLTTAF